MRQNPTTIATWAHAIVRALESYGIDGNALCDALGINAQRLMDPHYRIPVVTMTKLWQQAVAQSGDSAFGLQVAEQVSPTTFHALGFAALASRDFQEVAHQIMTNSDVISEVAKVSLQIKGQDGWFRIDLHSDSPEVSHEAIDAFMASVIAMGRKFVGITLPLTQIYMQRPEPVDRLAFETFFGVPIEFSAQTNALVFPLSSIRSLMPGYNPALIQANEQVLRDYKTSQANTLASQVVTAIEQILPDEPLQASVAEKLHMSVRKMQRHLETENTGYQTLLDEFRKSRALALLSEGRLSLKVVAHELGFANQSAFTRAFKRWTGETPNQVLKRKG